VQEEVRQIVREAIVKIIRDTTSEANIRRATQLHETKIHFVPAKYRVLGGLLQSLNIKFGNFIEKLIALVVEKDNNVEALPESGKRVSFSMTAQTDSFVDQYITRRQLPGSPDRCDELFASLLHEIVEIERRGEGAKQTITKDVDALFRANGKQVVYLEIKYNDDHDTGKFVDINRKFIKTYAGLVNHLEIENTDDIKPILYYLNPVKRWGPIYVPSSHIYRGRQLFDEYFEIRYDDIDEYLRNLSDDESIMAIFDELYQTIRHGVRNPDLL
jgi:hypothetical protein